ncbi:hypothetical protein CHLRE_16g652050v5 [Chlamydomonas reinhardtii]|uniref:FAD-binding domain-containing protein n=1 Tax=Chlamydomonas reinhardtii TaxID=3055 RepID=A0A2K3CSX0_CHLRE|nr:uncharacterized protein CHLRE_16g652050v5 [Chlamydomonas reinhardtii]PNW71384.1 hypothetical protein CHLRE_16g652050v5 [Chlamydomonas reinhardtii]
MLVRHQHTLVHSRGRATGHSATCLRARVHRRRASTVASADASSNSPWGEPVLVAGAGIAGLAVAVALHKVGVPVRVYERGPGLRQEGAAIGLWSNAWRALEELGAAEALRPGHLLLNRVELCSAQGEVLRGFDFAECDVGPTGLEFRGVRRAALLQALYDRLPPDVVCFDTGVEEVLGEQGAASTGGGGGGVTVRLADGRTVRGSCLVGADGVRSAVARHLQLPAANYGGYVALRGVAEFPSPASSSPSSPSSPSTSTPAGGPGLPLNTIRQIWGAGTRAGLYPLSPSSYYWYTCFNADEAAAEAPPATPEARQAVALAAVKGWAWSVEECIRRTPPEDITWSRISDRWTAGAFGRGVVTLAGDAAHPMTPNLGQGGCVALEDAVVLGRSLGQLAAAAGQRGQAAAAPPAAGAVAAALRAYEAERSRRCLPLTVRSNLMGQALQIPLAPVVAVRNAFVKAAFQPGHFLDHTAYDCGRLQQ